MTTLNNKKTGKKGEEIAVEYLKKNGYTIVESNATVRWGEIDIIAGEGNFLVFVEVKTRIGTGLGYPEESLTRGKLMALKRAMEIYIMKNELRLKQYRLDVVSILMDINNNVIDLQLWKNAMNE